MEQFGLTPHTQSFRGRSVRTIFTFVLAVLSAALLLTIFLSPVSQAQAGTAEWSGTALQYNGKKFLEGGKATRNQFPGISVDAPYYLTEASSNPLGAQGSNIPRDVIVIYFSPGVDPPTATSAQYVQFTYTPNTDTYSNPSNQATITIDGEHGAEFSNCTIEGIGYIICPVTNFLAIGMDWVFEVISGFMEVQPLSTNRDSGLYVGWDVMRNIANIAFLITFLIIVYAQVTGIQAGSYGIKKLLPRLIVAAVLVNLSYIICALAVDLSNIIGYGLQSIFIEIRNQIFQVDNVTWNSDYMITWESIVGFILSGGTAVGGLVFAAKAAIGFGPGVVILILPVLAGLLVAVLVVLLVLAARQALITILVLLAPLAFVAYLLPNTEGWFNKWRSLFMTMLIFYPAFAVVFGGSQLAGAVIIQNASNINIIILGMIVQVAPLVITPFLWKFSGNLLSRLGAFVNDPNKGIIDRAKKYANSRAEHSRDKWHGGLKQFGGKPINKPIGRARRMSRWMAGTQRRFDTRAANSKAAADNSYHQSRAYQKAHEYEAAINLDKERVDADNAAHVERAKTKNGLLYSRVDAAETAKQGLETAKISASIEVDNIRANKTSNLHLRTLETKAAEATHEELKNRTAKTMDEYKSVTLDSSDKRFTAANELKKSTINAAAEKQGIANAQYEAQRTLSEAMKADTVAGEALRKVAASVAGVTGETRAKAQAVAQLNKLDGDILSANKELLSAEASAAGKTIKDYSNAIATAVRENDTATIGSLKIDDDKFRAALQLQAEEGNMSLFEELRGSKNVNQSIVSEVISENVPKFKASGGFHLQANPNLNVDALGEEGYKRELAKARLKTLASVSPENIAGLKAGWVEAMANPTALQESIRYAREDGNVADIVDAYMAVKRTLTNDDVIAKLDNRGRFIKDIDAALADDLSKPRTDNPWS